MFLCEVDREDRCVGDIVRLNRRRPRRIRSTREPSIEARSSTCPTCERRRRNDLKDPSGLATRKNENKKYHLDAIFHFLIRLQFETIFPLLAHASRFRFNRLNDVNADLLLQTAESILTE